ncbi:MAG: hypothetical protein ACETVO_05545 [bacterium]
MKRARRISLILFLFLWVGTSSVFGELEVSGFVDVLGQGQQGENTTFGMGAFEIDFESEFSSKVSFEGAVVVEGEEVGLGQTLVDFKLLNEDKLGLQAGLLDMPFGIDYHVFATPDRKLVTPPLVTELMMDGGWGDVGVNFYGSLTHLNYNLYLVNGMGEDSGVPVNQLADNNNAKTVGGRIGVLPTKGLELGFSYAQGPYLNGTAEQALSRIGGDIQFVQEPLEAKGEFIKGEEELPGAGKNEHEGLYIQLLGRASEKGYGVIRYGYWKPKGDDRVTRITIGLGYDLIENVSLRGEYQINDETLSVDNNLFSVQAVLSF